LNNILEKIWSK